MSLITAIQFRRYIHAIESKYAQLVKQVDIRDTARSSFEALRNAAFDEQRYLLTGETPSAQAFAMDIQTWNDEHATLRLIATNDPMTQAARALESDGNQAVAELEAVMSACKSSGQDAALTRFRQGQALRLIDKAGEGNARIAERYGRISTSPPPSNFVKRLFEAAVALAILALAGGILLLFATSG